MSNESTPYLLPRTPEKAHEPLDLVQVMPGSDLDQGSHRRPAPVVKAVASSLLG
jgi:hypothetical protein